MLSSQGALGLHCDLSGLQPHFLGNLQLSISCDWLIRYPEELWNLHLWDHPRTLWLGSYGFGSKRWPAEPITAQYSMYFFCELSYDWAVRTVLTKSLGATCTHAGHSTSFGPCGTYGPPLFLGLELFIWTHILALVCPYCDGRVTLSLQHSKAAGLEAGVLYP